MEGTMTSTTAVLVGPDDVGGRPQAATVLVAAAVAQLVAGAVGLRGWPDLFPATRGVAAASTASAPQTSHGVDPAPPQRRGDRPPLGQ